MNVRVTPIDALTRSLVYTSIVSVRCAADGTVTLVATDGDVIVFRAEAYLDFSVDNDGAVT